MNNTQLKILSLSEPFRALDKEALEIIAEKCIVTSIQSGTILFEEDDVSDGLYIIVSGLIEIYKNNKSKKIAHNHKGHTIGSITLSRLNKRSASAYTVEPTTLIKFPKASFEQLAQQRPDITRFIEQALINRTHRLHLGFVMRTNPMFTNLPIEVLNAIENMALITFVKNGDILWEQGNASSYFYIVITGRLRIWHSSPTKIRSGLLKEIGPGETVGELGTITHEARKAGLRSLRDSTIACITREQLTELLTRYPEVINTLLVRIVAHHFEAPNPKHEHAKNASNTIALIPINAGVSVGKIGHELGSALAVTGKTLVIDSTTNDTLLGIPGFSQSPLDNAKNTTFFNWLNDLEFKHQHIILVADNSCSNWTRRCVHQADHLLFVANSDVPSYGLGTIEHEILTTENHLGIRKSLLLIHPKDTKVPKKTQKWLSSRKIGMHYHLRRGHEKDFARLARFLTGRSVGLVLGGGAARGFAHIGVLRALEEKNIPVDLIGGTSMGALIAAQYAMQQDLTKITRSTLQLCLAGDKLTIPLVSLYGGFKMANGLYRLFKQAAIEDLWCRFYSVSCNLSRAKVMVHDSGPLLDAVTASNIPPGLFPPKVVDGDLLVDGALLNNVPVDIMTRYNEGGLLIAVDVNPKDDLLANTSYKGGLSGWQVLKDKLSFTPKMQIPSILDVLIRSTSIGGLAQQKNVMTGIADFYLTPPVADYPLLAYKNADKIIEDSYQYTLKQIATWQFKL